MWVYLLATAFSCLITAVWYRRRERCSWRGFVLWLLLAALPLGLVAAARWHVGTDFSLTYLPEYKALTYLKGEGRPAAFEGSFTRLVREGGFGDTPCRVRNHFVSVLGKGEIGYHALMEASWATGLGFRAILAFCAILTTLMVFLAIFRQSRWPVLAVFLYVFAGDYFLSLNVMRQYVAVALVLFAVPYVRERRLLPFLGCVAVAFLFHRSALLLLPCYLLSRFEIRPKSGFVLIAVAFAASFVLAPFVERALPMIGFANYVKYFHNIESEQGFEWLLFAVNICFVMMGAWYWERAKAGNQFFPVWYGMMVIGTAALAMSGTLPLMKRINIYFGAANFLMLPEMLLAEGDARRRRILTGLVVAVFVAETGVSVCLMNKNGVLPYQMAPQKRVQADARVPPCPWTNGVVTVQGGRYYEVRVPVRLSAACASNEWSATCRFGFTNEENCPVRVDGMSRALIRSDRVRLVADGIGAWIGQVRVPDGASALRVACESDLGGPEVMFGDVEVRPSPFGPEFLGRRSPGQKQIRMEEGNRQLDINLSDVREDGKGPGIGSWQYRAQGVLWVVAFDAASGIGTGCGPKGRWQMAGTAFNVESAEGNLGYELSCDSNVYGPDIKYRFGVMASRRLDCIRVFNRILGPQNLKCVGRVVLGPGVRAWRLEDGNDAWELSCGETRQFLRLRGVKHGRTKCIQVGGVDGAEAFQVIEYEFSGKMAEIRLSSHDVRLNQERGDQ